MASYNKVILMGHLTRDIEIKTIPSGTIVGEVGLAVNEVRKDANGDKIEEVSFIDLVMWGKTAEVMEKYLSKGSAVLVEGKIKQDRWKTENDENRSKIRVVVREFSFVGGKSDEAPAKEEVLGDPGSLPF